MPINILIVALSVYRGSTATFKTDLIPPGRWATCLWNTSLGSLWKISMLEALANVVSELGMVKNDGVPGPIGDGMLQEYLWGITGKGGF